MVTGTRTRPTMATAIPPQRLSFAGPTGATDPLDQLPEGGRRATCPPFVDTSACERDEIDPNRMGRGKSDSLRPCRARLGSGGLLAPPPLCRRGRGLGLSLNR